MKNDSVNTKSTHQNTLKGIELHDHACLIYSSIHEQLDVVSDLIKDGLENNESCLYILDGNTEISICNALESKGISVTDSKENGSLKILHSKEIFLEFQHFDFYQSHRFFLQIMDEIKAKGFKRLRIVSEIYSTDENVQDIEKLIEYELKINDLIKFLDIIMVCQCDFNSLEPEIIKRIISIHPIVIYDGKACKNSYYLTPNEYLSPDRDKLEVLKLLHSLNMRGQNENDLLNLAFQHQSFIDGFTGMIFYKDLEDRFIWVNDNYIKSIGIPKEILLNNTISELFPKADNDNYTNDDYEVITTGLPKRNIIERVKSINGEKWVRTDKVPMFNRSGEITGILGFSFDITEEVKLQKSLKKSEELYHSVYDNSPLAFGIWDNEFRFIDWNKRAEELFGWSKEEVLGKRFVDLLIPKEIRSSVKNVASNLLNEGMARITANENITKDGTILFCEWHNTLLHDSEGNLVGAISLGLDKTESLRIENERRESDVALRKAKTEAEVANKAKSQFLANMSHEIRTPMNGVMGMSQLLLYTDLTEDQMEMVNIIKTSSQTLLQIINDILDISKIEVGKVELKLENVDILNLINRIEKLFNPIAKNKNLSFTVKVENDVPRNLLVDSVRLTQVITNLVGNSIKFTENGKIELLVKKIKVIGHKVQLIFSVSDTGIGIKEEDIPRLFNYFTQLDDTNTKSFQGTGLGLAISKSIVEIMNGEIGVESEIGKGSTFYFSCWVDAICKVKNSTDFIYVERDEQSLKNIKILLVEDDFVSQLVIKQMCKIKNLNIEVASNGKKALELLANTSFNLILMDVQMPEMSGIDVTKIIRENESETANHIPIIATTAYAMEKDKENALKAGMDDYLSKPIDIKKLVDIIDKWVK